MTHKARILVVDDILEVRGSIQKMLQEEHKEDWEIMLQASSEDALVALQSHKPFSVVITDIQLPNSNEGLNVIKHAKKNDPTIEVIVYTAHHTKEIQLRANELGIWDYITYNYELDNDRLVRSVERALEHRALTSELIKASQELAFTLENHAKDMRVRYRYALGLGFVSLIVLFLLLLLQNSFSDKQVFLITFWAVFLLCFMAWAIILGVSEVQIGKFKAMIKQKNSSFNALSNNNVVNKET